MKFSDLEFVRLAIEKPQDIGGSMMLFKTIPRELFEQVKDDDLDIDKLYQLSQSLLSNSMVQFYILVDKDNKIKGVLWGFANVLFNSIDIVLLSVDKEYQFDDAIEETLKFIKSWQEDAKIRIVTTRTSAYEKAGFEISKKTIMEVKS